MRRFFALCALGLTMLLVAQPSRAHERIASGPLQFVIGWGTEPAYAGFMNSVQLRISDAAGNPVSDVPAGAIKVLVDSAGQNVTLDMAPNFRVGVFGEPGDYRAWIIPTRPGKYTFKFTGTARGQKVNTTVASGEQTFDDIQNPSEVQFPEKDPSSGDLAQKIERESKRVEAKAAAADDVAASAKTFGYVGTGTGLIGIALAVAALARKRG